MANPKKEPEAVTPEVPYDPWKDMLSVRLPRATGNEQNFELVSVNSKTFKIMRGTTVRVPRPVYDVLSESMRMEDRLIAFNEAQAGSVPT